ncbi:MAG: succinyldiaminopimelate transaminase [Proteobacteria bacterium]|nr:succinyldiaminopimelate transaminase [Pseudomonadota bacterium]
MWNTKLEHLQPYPFERLRELHKDCQHDGELAHIPLSLGEPKHAPPDFVVQALANAQALTTQLGIYPATKGNDDLRSAISQWLGGRFGIGIDPATQVLPVYGTREALLSVAQALLSGQPGSLVGMPNPFYQIYEGAALLAGARPLYIANVEANDYRADFGAVTADQWQAVEMVYICSPGNPTGQIMTAADMQALIELAYEHDFIVVSDECYSELYYDDDNVPCSLLSVAEQVAKAHNKRPFAGCLSFHSLSKRSNLPGLRSGFVAGDSELMQRYLSYRTYHGCAMSAHHQHASTLAWRDEAHVVANRNLYREKFAAVSQVLRPHYDLRQPEGGFYHWLRTPIDDRRFSQLLLQQQHVTVMPGTFLGRVSDDDAASNPGQGHVRVAWVAGLDDCLIAAQRLADFAATL